MSFIRIPKGSNVFLTASFFTIYIFAITLIFLSIRTIDSDVFFLITNGNDILNSGNVPDTLLHTVHNGFNTIIQQWLVSVIDAIFYNAFGFNGILLVSFLGFLVVSGLMLIYLRIRDNTDHTKNMFIYSVCIFPLICFFVARPTQFTIAVLLLFLIFTELAQKKKNDLYLISWPLLSFLLINLHSSLWWFLLCFALSYVFPDIDDIVNDFKGYFKKKKFSVFMFLLMPLFALINPNGINGVLYLPKSYFSAVSELNIAELGEPSLTSLTGIYSIIFIICMYTYIRKYKRNVNTYYVLLAAGSYVLSVLHLRDRWLLGIGTLPLFCSAIRLPDVKFAEKKGNLPIISFLIMFVIMIVVNSQNMYVTDNNCTPKLAADYLDENADKDISLFTGFNNGAYLEFRGYNIYMDARPELYTKVINGQKDVLEEYVSLSDADCDFETFIASYDFDYMIVEANTFLQMYLNNNDVPYECVLEGNGYFLYEKQS